MIFAMIIPTRWRHAPSHHVPGGSNQGSLQFWGLQAVHRSLSKRRDSRSRRRSPHGRDELKIRSRSRRHRQRASRSPREEDMRQKQRRMILKERQADEKALAEKFAEPRDGATLSCFLCGRQGFKGQFALSQHWWSKHEDHPEAALRAKSSAS